MKIKLFQYLVNCVILFQGQIFGQSFTWQRALQPDSTEGWHRFFLPPEITGKTQAGFSDLRILAVGVKGDTVEAPYTIREMDSYPASATTASYILNRVNRDKTYYYTLEQVTTKPIGEIQLAFGLQNFDLRITLEGSQDQREWFAVLNDYRILSIKNQVTDYSFTRLLFPEANFKYYRISIPAGKDPDLQAAWMDNPALHKQEYYQYPSFKQNGNLNTAKKQTTWVINLPENLPVSRLQVHVADKLDYIRRMAIQSLVEHPSGIPEDEPRYSTLANTILSSFSQNSFTFQTTVAKQIKLIIDHDDNAPLTIDSVTLQTIQQEVLVRLPTATTYLMVYGDKKAKHPQYDISGVLENRPLSNFHSIAIGEEKAFSASAMQHKIRWWENNTLLYALMGVIILVLGWFSLSMIRKKE